MRERENDGQGESSIAPLFQSRAIISIYSTELKKNVSFVNNVYCITCIIYVQIVLIQNSPTPILCMYLLPKMYST